ncbi:hypothetical protein J132_02270 [Termitomyces sp. J132]|nr:hypothetical protein J132_02270 [Termitomyces sp. J132]
MSNLASQFEKTMMAHAFLECVDQLLAMARASLVKDPRLAVTAIFQTWLQWFKTAGSGVEWPELATVEKECRQLYEQYKGEEWVHPFDVPVDPSLEFLMDNLTAGMTVSAPAVASASNTAKHPVGALAVVRGEGWSKGRGDNEAANCGDIQEHPVGALAVVRGEGWSKGRGDNEAANCGDIQEVGPSTPKAVAGGVARGLVTSPRLATTPRSKGKGKGKAQEEEDEDIEDQIEEMFTNKCLVTLLHWQKALMVVDTGLGARVKLEKAKGKVMVLLEKQQEYKHMQGACDNCWADNDPEGCCKECEGLCGVTEGVDKEGVVVGGGGGAKVKSREVVESDEDDNNSDGKAPLAWKRAASPASVASEEGEGDVEMRETTPLVMIAEVEREASDMEVKGKEELKAVPATAEEDKEEERAEEAKVQ